MAPPYFPQQWKDKNSLPVQLKVWGKGKQLLGARKGLQCSPYH